MTPVMKTMKQWQDEYFTLVERVEAPMVDLTSRVAGIVAKYVPTRPAQLDQVPKTKDLVENQLMFGKRFVDEQAAFVRRMVEAMDPVLVKYEHVPPTKTTVASKTVTSKTATKSTTRQAKTAGTRKVPRRVTPNPA